MPSSAKEAKALIKQASQAPDGRGEDTIVDTKVRKVWQLEPHPFQLSNPKWDTVVDEAVKAVKKAFAIKQKIAAERYKLLVYEKTVSSYPTATRKNSMACSPPWCSAYPPSIKAAPWRSPTLVKPSL